MPDFFETLQEIYRLCERRDAAHNCCAFIPDGNGGGRVTVGNFEAIQGRDKSELLLGMRKYLVANEPKEKEAL